MKKLVEKITEKQISIIILIAFLSSLLPILILALYNYPGADDFSASYTLRHVWLETGSVWLVLVEALEYVKYTYMNWSGLFMSMFWTSLQPAVFGEQFYCITTFICVVFLLIGGFYLGHVLVTKCLKGNKYQAVSLSSIYLFLIIQCMPDGNEGLYWHSGVVNYTWAFAFLLMLTGAMLALVKENESKKKIGKTILATIMAVFVGGGNFITALQGCIWMCVIVVGKIIHLKISQKLEVKSILRNCVSIFIPLVVMLVSFMISVLAPGNQVRIAGAGEGLGPIKAIILSFVYCLEIPFESWFHFSTFLLLALAVPFMWKIVKNSNLQFRYPGVIAILGFGISSAAFTPSLYAQGNMIAGRLHDTAYFVFVTILFGVMFYVIGWIQQLTECCVQSENEGKMVKTSLYIIGVFAFFVGASLLDTVVNEDTYVGSTAIISLISGQAEEYKEENKTRLELLYSSEETNIEFEGFYNPPMLLHFQDVTFDENDWINKAVARYYGKESVKRVN